MVLLLKKKINKYYFNVNNYSHVLEFICTFKQIFFHPLASEKAKLKALEKLLLQYPGQAIETREDFVQKSKVWEKAWLESQTEEILFQEETTNKKEKMNIIEELDAIKLKVRSNFFFFI